VISIQPMKRVFQSGDREFTLDVPGFDLEDGQITFIVGPNGSGKSLYLMSLSESLRVMSDSKANRGVCLIKQSPDDNVSNSLSVLENISLWLPTTGLYNFFFPTRRLNRHIEQWEIDFPTLRHVWTQLTSTLSGGQKQIIVLISRFLSNPGFVLLDEALSAVDEINMPKALEFLKKHVSSKNCGCLVVSHDIDSVSVNADAVLIFSQGKLIKKIRKMDIKGPDFERNFRNKILDNWPDTVFSRNAIKQYDN
jgi:ABC-type Mn2+/Zn2+ transport system ATPase subunit